MSETGRVIVLDVVGLQRDHLSRAPNLAALFDDETVADLSPPFPAVTVPVQTTLAEGRSPAAHGDVSNGEFDREARTAAFWERDRGDRLRLWEAASDEADLTTGVLFFQHLVGTSADVAITPKPIEDENNELIEMDCYTRPDSFYDELRAEYGHFPLHRYWGPAANEESTEWILDAARESVERFDPDLLWVYVPYLDYDGLRHGPDGLGDAVETVDGLLGDFLDFLRGDERWSETAVTVVSEYGFHAVDTPILPNRALREAGLLSVRDDGDGGEDVDVPGSDAFAMVDHQVAHVYVDGDARDGARELLAELDGVERVLDDEGKAEYGIDHPNAGDLVLVAEPDAWFQYYWWTDPEDAPSYADEMDIHSKPGFDACELFFGETGLVTLDPTRVGGSHGRTDVPAFYGLGGPAAPDVALPDAVDARAVAPTIADLLDIEDDLGMAFEVPSLLDDRVGTGRRKS